MEFWKKTTKGTKNFYDTHCIYFGQRRSPGRKRSGLSYQLRLFRTAGRPDVNVRAHYAKPFGLFLAPEGGFAD